LSDRRHWFVLRCKPSLEITAEKQIKHLGMDAMVPYVEGGRRPNKRTQRYRKYKFPLFPGYLFASWVDWAAGWRRIGPSPDEKHNPDRIDAIYGFLHPVWTTMPYILPPADVEYLESIADGKYKPEVHNTPCLKVGDEVLISEGPFQGHRGKTTEIRGENVTLDVPIFGKFSKIKVEGLAKLKKV
jgi:transcription antitermination factor NusG